jgi:hypothetical protein
MTRVGNRHSDPDIGAVKTTVDPFTAGGQNGAGRDDAKWRVFTNLKASDMPRWAVKTIHLLLMVHDEEFKGPFLVGLHVGSACLLCCDQFTWLKNLPGAVGVEVTRATVENSKYS